MFSKLLLVLGVAVANGSNLMHIPNYSVRYELDKQYDPIVLTNLVFNWDLLRDSDGDNIPDYGFTYTNATNITLSDGIATFTATSQFGGLRYLITPNNGDKIYYFANFKSSSSLVSLLGVANVVQANTYHSGSGQFEFKSNLQTSGGNSTNIQILDYRTSGWTPIEVDYIGAINLTATYGAGNEPSKEQLDPIIEFGFVGGYRQGYDEGYYDGQYDGYNDGWEDGYNDGEYDGYNDGWSDGYRDGHEWGYTDGYIDGKDDGYDIGFADAEAFADGNWLGSLVFGTVGGIVGFLFALSDFEVLGVSIMSIITLFVAIGIIKLLIKVIK